MNPMHTVSSQQPAASSQHSNNFDAIRIAAALAVLVSHHYALTAQAEPSFLGLHTWGGTAVIVFFVISGYLVTSSWYNDPSALRFAQRRILRIWPALAVVVVLTAYGLGAWVTSLPLMEYWKHRATLDYLLNIKLNVHYVLPGIFESNPYPRGVNGSLWTIPLEVRCYVVMALAGLLGLMRYRGVWMLLIAAYLVWFMTKGNADVTGKVNYGRELSAYFLAGSALYLLQPYWDRKPAVWTLSAFAAAASLWVVGWHHTALFVLLPLLVLYAGTRSTAVVCRFGRWGDPSYGIYLIAYPTQQAVIHFLWPELGFAGTLVLATAITVVLAYASWHGVEKIALKLKPRKQRVVAQDGKNRTDARAQPALLGLIQMTSRKRFGLLLALLCLLYTLWMVASWPGVLGQDSLAVMKEVDSGREFQAGKPAFWYLWVLALYGPWRLVEIPIICQLLVCALVCARILNWMLDQGMRKSFWYGLLGVSLAPSVVYYASSLYSDGIYAIATAGMMFEIWRSYRERRVDSTACWMLLLTVPFALFSRPNGLINAIALVALAFALPSAGRWRLGLLVLPWCIVALVAHSQFKYRTPIGSVFPMALYETVGFLEHRPMGLWERNEPRISPKTVEALTAGGKDLDHIQRFYDHYYWDPLVFFPAGPALLALSEPAKKTVIREFFSYNLWHNFPAFAASRVNIFLYAAFANGGIAGPTNAENILPQTQANSKIQFRNGKTHQTLLSWFDFTLKHRTIFWTPWVGVWLILLGFAKTWQRRDRAGFIVCMAFGLQLAAVFTFSIAGEYRYLLAFFAAPLVLLPVLYAKNYPAHA